MPYLTLLLIPVIIAVLLAVPKNRFGFSVVCLPLAFFVVSLFVWAKGDIAKLQVAVSAMLVLTASLLALLVACTTKKGLRWFLLSGAAIRRWWYLLCYGMFDGQCAYTVRGPDGRIELLAAAKGSMTDDSLCIKKVFWNERRDWQGRF